MKNEPQLKSALINKQRLAAVERSRLLDSPREQMFDNITLSVCEKLNVPISLVTIIAPERQFFKSAIGLEPELLAKRETPIEDSTCQYVVEKDCLLRIDDVENDAFFRLHEGLRGVSAGAYLGAPLRIFGQAIGSVCAVDTKARKWTNEDIAFLEEKAGFIADIVSRRA